MSQLRRISVGLVVLVLVSWALRGVPAAQFQYVPPPPLPSAGDGVPVMNVRDFGAVGDGVTNDRPAIQAAIDATPDGGTIYLPTGTYCVAGAALQGIQIISRNHLTLRGDGWSSVIKRCDANTQSRLGAISDTTGIHITQLAFDQNGISAFGGLVMNGDTGPNHHLRVDYTRFFDSAVDAGTANDRFGPLVTGPGHTYVWIEHNLVQDLQIEVNNVEYAFIRHNHIERPRWYGCIVTVSQNPLSGDGPRHYEITHNTCITRDGLPAGILAVVDPATSSDKEFRYFTIAHNTIRSLPAAGAANRDIYIGTTNASSVCTNVFFSDFRVESNDIYRDPTTANRAESIFLNAGTNCNPTLNFSRMAFINNRIMAPGGNVTGGLILRRLTDSTVQGNVVYGPSDIGIGLTANDRVSFADNTVIGTMAYGWRIQNPENGGTRSQGNRFLGTATTAPYDVTGTIRTPDYYDDMVVSSTHASSGVIESHARIRHLAMTADVTFTSAPQIRGGKFEGQRLTLINTSETFSATLRDVSVQPTSTLQLRSGTVTLGPRQAMELVWNATLSRWFDLGPGAGSPGEPGEPGPASYTYVAYASDDQGSDFSLTPGPDRLYVAFLATTSVLPEPTAGDFTGLWQRYRSVVRELSIPVTDMTGASVTVPDAIPADVAVLGLFVTVTEDLEGEGVTALQITDTDCGACWGTLTSLTAGSQTTYSHYPVTSIGVLSKAASHVTLTPQGGTLTGGAVQLRIIYSTGDWGEAVPMASDLTPGQLDALQGSGPCAPGSDCRYVVQTYNLLLSAEERAAFNATAGGPMHAGRPPVLADDPHLLSAGERDGLDAAASPPSSGNPVVVHNDPRLDDARSPIGAMSPCTEGETILTETGVFVCGADGASAVGLEPYITLLENVSGSSVTAEAAIPGNAIVWAVLTRHPEAVTGPTYYDVVAANCPTCWGRALDLTTAGGTTISSFNLANVGQVYKTAQDLVLVGDADFTGGAIEVLVFYSAYDAGVLTGISGGGGASATVLHDGTPLGQFPRWNFRDSANATWLITPDADLGRVDLMLEVPEGTGSIEVPGSTGQVLYHQGGALGASSDLTFSGGVLQGPTINAATALTQNNTPVILEGDPLLEPPYYHATSCPGGVTTARARQLCFDEGGTEDSYRIWRCHNPAAAGASSTLCDHSDDWALVAVGEGAMLPEGSAGYALFADPNATVGATTDLTTVYSAEIPANTLTTDSLLWVQAGFVNPTQGVAPNHTDLVINFCGTTLHTFGRSSPSDLVYSGTWLQVAPNSQRIVAKLETRTGGGSSGTATDVRSLDTTQPCTLSIQIKKGSTTDSWTLRTVSVVKLPGGSGGTGGEGGDTVKVTSNDTTAGFLGAKLQCGAGLTCSTGNPGGDETLNISTSVAGARKTWIPVGAGGMSRLENSTCLAPTEKVLRPGGRTAWSLNGCARNDLSAVNFVVLPEEGDATSVKWNLGAIDLQLGVLSTAASPTDTLRVTASAYCRTPGTDLLAAYTFANEQEASVSLTTQYRPERLTISGMTVNGGPCSQGDEVEVVWRIRNVGSTITQAIDNHILWGKVGVTLQ